MNPGDQLFADRFRLLERICEREGIGLYRVRDLASESELWLLRLHGSPVGSLEGWLRYRLHRFAALPLFRSYELGSCIHGVDEIYLTMQPREIAAISAPEAVELAEGFESLARAGLCAGHLSRAELRSDACGAFFLPTAYLQPAALTGSACVPYSRDQLACEAELRAMGSQAVTATAKAGGASAFDWQGWAEASSERARGLHWVGDRLHALEGLEHLARACADTGRHFLTVGKHWHQPIPSRPRGSAAPILAFLDFEDYGAFAGAIAALRRAGWMDGDESYFLVTHSAIADGAATLAAGGLANRFGREWTEFEEAAGGEPGPERGISGLGARVLQILQVAGRALPVDTLRQALHVDFEELIPEIVQLEEDGVLRTLCAISDEGPAAPALLLEDARAGAQPLSAERESELRHLLRAVLPPPKGRVGIGRAWLGFLEAVRSRDDGALQAGRRLAQRARKRQLELLEFAVHEKLLAAGEWIGLSAADRCRTAVVLGKQLRLHGRISEAEEIFAGALEEFREESGLKAAGLVAEVVLQHTDLLEHQARFSDIDELLENVLQRYGDGLQSEMRGRLYLHHARALRHLGRFPESFRKGELALKLFSADKHPRELSEIYTNLGLTHWASSDYSSARDAYQRGLELAEAAGDELSVSRLWNNLGLAYRASGEFAHAEEALTRSAQIKSRIGDLKGVAATQLNLGFVHLDQGEPSRAQECALQCLELARKLSQGELEAQATGLMGECACAVGDYDEAHRLYLENLALCEAQSMRNEHLATLRRLVDLLLRKGDLDAAAVRLQEAREAIPFAGSRFEPALLDVLEARLLRETGADEAALDLFGSGAAKLGTLRRPDLQLEALVERAQLQLALSRVSAARKSMVGIRELLEEQPEIRVPSALAELEATLSSGEEAAVSSLDDGAEILGVLAEFTRRARAGSDEAIDAATQLLLQILGAESVSWFDAEKRRCLRRDVSGVHDAHPPRRLTTSLREASPEMGEIETGGSFAWRIAGRNQWLVIESPEPPRSRERALLESVASVLAMALRAPLSPGEGEPELTTPARLPDHGIIGESAAIRDVLRQIDLVKDNDVTVLLLGENGTGKDLVARAIYRSGRRADGPFHAVNCAAIPHSLLESELFGHERGAFTGAHERHLGLFERADGGTLFLDEIGEMDAAMQSKLLRVLQDGSFTRVGGNQSIRSDVRVLAATNRDLSADVSAGRFRMDLYFRLNVISIRIPALRERAEDIGLLAHHFIDRAAPEFDSRVRGIRQEAVARLMAYSWPGNVRELENVIKNAIVFAEGSRIRVEDLPEHVLGGQRLHARRGLQELVQALLESEEADAGRPLMPRLELLLAYYAVQMTQNKTEAARLLGVSKPTIYSRLQRYEALYGAEPPVGAFTARSGGRPEAE